ncbi:beta-1,3-glucanase family protein [Legionella parisiensis]|uniref:beta-1,3-glucanase family protein n=1 Tax=Legionella parisiensis TaxID=45071 RepID=UPI001ED99348|nr:beta-1,3-glucanase family protein [Legionella parisiensis]
MSRLSVLMLGLTGLLTISEYAFSQNQCQGGGMSVRFDLSKTNNTHIENRNTYIVVLGIDPTTKKHAYVKFNDGNHIGTLVDITDIKMNGKDYGISLSELTPNSGGIAQACIPHLTSGRIYISFGNTLDIPTDKDLLTPKQPDVNNPQTTTNGTLFDKVEFNYSTSGETVINPTGVDFIAIPYTIQQAGHEYGHFGGLNAVIKNMKTIICRSAGETIDSPGCNQRWLKSEWSSLVVYNSANSLMRIDAPGRFGHRFSGYFTNYINELSRYYSSSIERSIKIDLKELNKGIWSGAFEPNSQTLVFSRDGESGPETLSYNLGSPQVSNSILMGAQAPFKNKNAVDATIARDLTSAIVSGMLMRKESAFIGKNFFDAQGNPVFRNKQQMQELLKYYFNNVDHSVDYNVNQCGATKDAPCVNVYSEAMHALSFDKNIDHPQESYLNSYAFSYDDFLGMDGTNTQTDAKPATIVIGDMKNRKIPHIDL